MEVVEVEVAVVDVVVVMGGVEVGAADVDG